MSSSFEIYDTNMIISFIGTFEKIYIICNWKYLFMRELSVNSKSYVFKFMQAQEV